MNYPPPSYTVQTTAYVRCFLHFSKEEGALDARRGHSSSPPAWFDRPLLTSTIIITTTRTTQVF